LRPWIPFPALGQVGGVLSSLGSGARFNRHLQVAIFVSDSDYYFILKKEEWTLSHGALSILFLFFPHLRETLF
jgi:hypothetical protein